MNAHPFSRLIELITFDQSIHQEQSALGQCLQEIEDIKQNIINQEYAQLAQQTAVAQARKTVDRIELDLQALDQQIREKKKKIDQVITHKESQALQRELDQLHTHQQEFENTLLKAWSSLEHAERALGESAKQAAQARLEMQQELSNREQVRDVTRASLDNLNKIRESKTVGVPAEWLEKYNAMRSFTSNPIVALEGESCGACFHELSTQELTRLRRGALLECQGCFRFVYNKEILGHTNLEDNSASRNGQAADMLSGVSKPSKRE